MGVDYTGEIGALHTKTQIDKIRSKGVKILSYFIKSEHPSFIGVNFNQTGITENRQLTLKQLFDMMYGKDGCQIDVQNITDIARTINKLFLNKS